MNCKTHIMDRNERYDMIDEGLRIYFLHESKDTYCLPAFKNITNKEYSVNIDEKRKESTLDKLFEYSQNPSFGNLLSKVSLEEEKYDSIVQKAGLSKELFETIRNDEVLPNRVPIVRLKNLLLELGIQFQDARNAILKTANLLKSKGEIFGYSQVSGSVAFRKKGSDRRNIPVDSKFKSDLFDNQDALDRYLDQLGNVMKP